MGTDVGQRVWCGGGWSGRRDPTGAHNLPGGRLSETSVQRRDHDCPQQAYAQRRCPPAGEWARVMVDAAQNRKGELFIPTAPRANLRTVT